MCRRRRRRHLGAGAPRIVRVPGIRNGPAGLVSGFRTLRYSAGHRIDFPERGKVGHLSIDLVSPFRSSHYCAAHSFANLGIKGTLAIYDSSAVLDLKFLHKRTAIMIGTSNPPHWSD